MWSMFRNGEPAGRENWQKKNLLGRFLGNIRPRNGAEFRNRWKEYRYDLLVPGDLGRCNSSQLLLMGTLLSVTGHFLAC